MSVEHSVVGWLTEPYDYQRPRRGQIRKGVILRLEERGAIIDVGLKRDGFVPQRDIERLGEEGVDVVILGRPAGEESAFRRAALEALAAKIAEETGAETRIV